MAKVTISEVQVLESECGFRDPFRFKIRFNCIEDLQEDLDWKIIYVGSANSSAHDQELDELSTGPIPVGTHEFVLEANGPNPDIIPTGEIVGVTVVLITCAYREQEFVRIGYYINNEYITEEMRENPPDVPQIDQLRRLIAVNPRVTRIVINWDGKDENTPLAELEQPTPFGFELSSSQTGSQMGGGAETCAGPQRFNDIRQHLQSMKQAGQQDGNQPRPPVFVENSMDCHNIQMSID